jgi:hypothetical protein
MGSAIASDEDGNVLVGGVFAGTVSLDGDVMQSAGATDALVWKLDGAGHSLWSKRFGDASAQSVVTLTTNDAGDVFLGGFFQGSVNFGGGPLTSVGTTNIFVAKLDPDGNYLWGKRFGSAAGQEIYAMTTDPSGNLIVVGAFYGTIDFGGGPLTSAGGNDLFVVEFDDAGNHLWSRRYGGIGSQYASAVVADASGVTLTGTMEGSIDFGGNLMTSAGGTDVFVARLDSDGNHIWSERFGGTAYDRGEGIGVDATGDAVVTGSFGGTVDFGGGPLSSVGATDIFLVRLDAAGNHVWSERFGDTDDQTGESLAIDASGNIVIAGYLEGTVDFGGGPLTSAGLGDFVVARFDPAGDHLWSRRFGGTSSEFARSVATDPLGDALLTGDLYGPVDFGGGPLPMGGGDDGFVLKLAK